MKPRYACHESLLALQKAVGQCAVACGLEAETDPVQETNRAAYAIGNLLLGREISQRIAPLVAKSNSCTQHTEELELERWCLSQTLSRNAEKLAVLEEKIRRLEAERADEKAACKQLDQRYMEAIQGLIGMRDSLLGRRELLTGNGTDNGDERMKLISISLRETANLLGKMGVTILEDSGAFDSTRHTIVETLPTDDDSQENQIARVFRPGYEYHHTPLRGQEVIIYVKERG